MVLFYVERGRAAGEKLREVKYRIDELLEKDKLFWRQRSRALWLKAGDRNTRYFHAKATQRMRRNRIYGLMDNTRQCKDKQKDLVKVVTDFYSTLFKSVPTTDGGFDETSPAFIRRVSVEMNKGLLASFKEDDVVGTLNQINPLKVPSPNRLSVLFFSEVLGCGGP
ncbi:hypothetical protein ACOSQ3_018624 [Xanthoceras sorbifolium]